MKQTRTVVVFVWQIISYLVQPVSTVSVCTASLFRGGQDRLIVTFKITFNKLSILRVL